MPARSPVRARNSRCDGGRHPLIRRPSSSKQTSSFRRSWVDRRQAAFQSPPLGSSRSAFGHQRNFKRPPFLILPPKSGRADFYPSWSLASRQRRLLRVLIILQNDRVSAKRMFRQRLPLSLSPLVSLSQADQDPRLSEPSRSQFYYRWRVIWRSQGESNPCFRRERATS